MRTLLLLTAATLALPSVAHADDTFEGKATGAKALVHVDDLVWALTAACDKGDDAQQRQCKALRDRRAAELTGATLILDADNGALDLGAWDAARKSVSVTLTSCVRCEGVTSEGKTWFVTGGVPKIEGGKIRGTNLYDTARQFQTGEVAAAWLKAVQHHKVELVAKVAAKPRWNVGGKEGIALDVIAYRVLTPCNGTVVLANPTSQNAAPDKVACAQGGAAVVALTPELVDEAMQGPKSVMKVCAKKEKAEGRAKLELTISDEGTLAGYEQTGDFVGTPMGKCIDGAMKSATFPRSAKPKTKIGYPLSFP